MRITYYRSSIAALVRLVPAFLVLRPRTLMAGPQQNDLK